MTAPKPVKQRRLTLKQKKFAKAYVEQAGNAKQAVITAYPNVTTANAQAVMGSKLVSNGNVQNEIRALLEAKGVDIDHLNEHLVQILNSDDLNVKNKGLRLAYEVIGALSKANTQVNVNAGLVALDIEGIREALGKGK